MINNKDPLIHFPFYCHQYMGLLNKYTFEEQGAFIRILCSYISEDGDICEDGKYRILSAFTKTEKQAVDKVYKPAILLAQEIIEKQKSIRQKHRENGQKGGRPRNLMVMR